MQHFQFRENFKTSWIQSSNVAPALDAAVITKNI